MPSITAALVPGRGREVQDAVVGELDPPRVDRHELHPAQRRLLDARADDRVALGRVGADQDRRVGVVEVREGAGGAGEPERLAQREATSASGRRASSCRCCWCRSRRASGAASRSSPRWSRARRRGRRSRPGRASVLIRVSSVVMRWIASSQVAIRKSPSSLISGAVRRSRRRRELVREAALQARVALVGGAVERGADRGDLAVARVCLQAAADAAVAAGGGDGRVEHGYLARFSREISVMASVGQVSAQAPQDDAGRVPEALVQPGGDAGGEAAAGRR